MNKIIGIELEELKEELRLAVRNEIENCLEENRFGLEFKDEVWDRKTAAEFLKVSPEKISDMYNNKVIPGTKLGREYLFLKSQIISVFKKVKK